MRDSMRELMQTALGLTLAFALMVCGCATLKRWGSAVETAIAECSTETAAAGASVVAAIHVGDGSWSAQVVGAVISAVVTGGKALVCIEEAIRSYLSAHPADAATPRARAALRLTVETRNRLAMQSATDAVYDALHMAWMPDGGAP